MDINEISFIIGIISLVASIVSLVFSIWSVFIAKGIKKYIDDKDSLINLLIKRTNAGRLKWNSVDKSNNLCDELEKIWEG